jgi:hypothetical protein
LGPALSGILDVGQSRWVSKYETNLFQRRSFGLLLISIKD